MIPDEWIPAATAIDELRAAGFRAEIGFIKHQKWIAYSRQGISGSIRIGPRGVDRMAVKRAIRTRKVET